MSSPTSRYLVTYDIENDRVRDRVATLLEGTGWRVQKSVFECMVDADGLERLTRGLTRELERGPGGNVRSVAPLRDGLSFTFHVDFDNLTDREVGLLLYSLRPTGRFRHKVGMGKPIGLGSVRLDVVGYFEVDRQERYTPAGLFARRYRRAWVPLDAQPADWPDPYAVERSTAEDLRGTGSWVDELRQGFRGSMSAKVRNALERLGEASFEPGQVSWPLVEDSDGETKSFEWFVSNAQLRPGDRKTLRPIQERGWPRLPRLATPRRRDR